MLRRRREPRNDPTKIRPKGGRRADLGGQFFRSAMEADIARLWNWYIGRGLVERWEYEPEVFTFTDFGYKRGPWAYTPDFRVVWTPVGASDRHALVRRSRREIFEVKGREQPSDRSKRGRMAKHYPDVKVTVIDKPAYLQMCRTIGRAIPGWEGQAGRRR